MPIHLSGFNKKQTKHSSIKLFGDAKRKIESIFFDLEDLKFQIKTLFIISIKKQK